MKILVTGGSGYIGSHTVLRLIQDGYEVIALDNFSNSSPEALQRVEILTGKKVILKEGDLTDRRVLEEVFSQHQDIFSVIHFAALKAVGESVLKPLGYYRNNVGGSIVLLEEMQKYGVKNLVFSSSCTVYGEPQKLPIDEEHPTGRVSSPYGRTKSMMEEIIEDIVKADSFFNAAILRYFNPIGAHKSGQIGEDPNGIPDNLIPFVCQVASGKLDKLKIFGNDFPTPDGTAIRDYLHVCDLADAHLKALQKLEKEADSFICNLGTGKGTSVLEIISSFEKATGKKIPFEFVERREGDVIEAWANPDFAFKLLGWKAVHTVDEMLADAWRWQSMYPNGYTT